MNEMELTRWNEKPVSQITTAEDLEGRYDVKRFNISHLLDIICKMILTHVLSTIIFTK